jgi:hypothetical protein
MRASQILSLGLGGKTEFMMFTLWDSMDAVKVARYVEP